MFPDPIIATVSIAGMLLPRQSCPYIQRINNQKYNILCYTLHPDKGMDRRKALAVVTLVMLVLSFSTPVIANEDGKFNSSNGCSCHSSSSTSTTQHIIFLHHTPLSTSYSIQIGLTGEFQVLKGDFHLKLVKVLFLLESV